MRALWRRVGRRGAFLLFLAILDLLYAFSLAVPARASLRSPTVTFIAGIVPLPAWAALWGAVGVLCLAGAFAARDRWAFIGAVLLKLLWGGVFFFGWAIAGLDRGWVSACIWVPLAGVVHLISSWPEPDVTSPRGAR